jgi:hypothetical protein
MPSEQGSGRYFRCATSTHECSVKCAKAFVSPTGENSKKLVEPTKICLGSWNAGSLIGKLRELVETMARRHVNILCVQETK